MAADYESLYVVRVTLQRLGNEILKTGRIERTSHTNYTVAGQTKAVKSQIRHRIHRVGYDD